MDLLPALASALAQLSDSGFRRIVLLGLLVSAAVLAALAALISFLLAHAIPADWAWAEVPVGAFGGLAGLVIAWFLFPAASALAAGLLSERIALAIEREDYPGVPPPRRAGAAEGFGMTLRMVALGLGLNLLAVPIYLLVPGVNLILFLVLNGYLITREYFESAAVRRFSPSQARGLRRRRGLGLWLFGMGLAGLLTVPGLNLLVPYLGFAAMIHLVERERIRQVAG